MSQLWGTCHKARMFHTTHGRRVQAGLWKQSVPKHFVPHCKCVSPPVMLEVMCARAGWWGGNKTPDEGVNKDSENRGGEAIVYLHGVENVRLFPLGYPHFHLFTAPATVTRYWCFPKCSNMLQKSSAGQTHESYFQAVKRVVQKVGNQNVHFSVTEY